VTTLPLLIKLTLMTFTYWLFVLGSLLLTAFISYGTFATARLLTRWRPDHNLLVSPMENLVRLVIILICLGLGRLSGLSAGALGWQFHAPGRQLLWGGVIGFGMGLVIYHSTRWVLRWTGQRFYSTTVIEYILPTNRRELVLVLLAMWPKIILEELLFRSLLLGGLAPIIPLSILLIGLSLLFGLLHSPQGVWGMVGSGLAGLLLGLLFLWQESLLTPLIAHYTTNAFQLIQAKRIYGPQETALK